MAKKRKLENKSAAEAANKAPVPVDEQAEQEEELEQEQQQQVQQEGEEEEEEQEQEIAEQEVGEDEDEEDEEEEDEDEENDALDDATAAQMADGNDNDEDEDAEEPVEKLLEPFTKEQLIDLLREAADNHFDVLDRIREIADVDPVHRKIFVHGLGWDTNAETLISAFKEYGEIEDCKAVSDKISGKSKGYGFILFKHRSGACKALKEPQKRIGNRMTACQLAAAGPVPAPVATGPPVSEYTQRKIYVSNVSADIDPQKLLGFFAKFGEIVEGPLGLDKQTGKFKGFTLFVYKTVVSAKKALDEPHKNFEGHILHCQRAIDGPKPTKPHFQNQQPLGSGLISHPMSGNSSFAGGLGTHGSASEVGTGHLMAPSAGVSFNQGTPQVNPVLGQALTALIASQGGALGLTNLLGSIGSSGMGAPMNQTVPSMVNNVGHGMQGGYGNQSVASNISPSLMGGYGNPHGMQGGYPNPQSGGRSQQGAGHMGYMGH